MLYPIELWVQMQRFIAFVQIPTILRLATLAQDVGTRKTATARSRRSQAVLAIELWVRWSYLPMLVRKRLPALVLKYFSLARASITDDTVSSYETTKGALSFVDFV